MTGRKLELRCSQECLKTQAFDRLENFLGALLGRNADGEGGSLAQAMTFMVAEGGDDLHDAVKLFNLPLLHEVGGAETVDDVFERVQSELMLVDVMVSEAIGDNLGRNPC